MDNLFWREYYEEVKASQRREWWILRITRVLLLIAAIGFSIAFIFDSAYWFVAVVLSGLSLIGVTSIVNETDKANAVESDTWEAFLESLESGEEMRYD